MPFVPGATVALHDSAAARDAAREYGLPLALKAAAGGGGKGLKVARSLDEIDSAFETARREAEAYFKNGTIYAERYLENPKHIELQILADKHGNVVHVGERDCSLQRRHQKLWEEAPATIPPSVRRSMREAGVRAAKAIGYDSAGTIECLVSGDAFYFLEMNTRIQVEHTVTEMIAGLDLVREQIRVAAGEPLGYAQDAIDFRGCAIEARVNAEDPAENFRPAPGTITAYREPGGPGVRVDSAAYAGWTIPPEYDSLVAKLVVWAPTREQAIARLRRADRRVRDRRRPDDACRSCARSATIQASSTHRTARQRSKRSRRRGERLTGRRYERPRPSIPARRRRAPRRLAPRLTSLRKAGASLEWKQRARADARTHR